jgi:short-subunit dehydrogenase
MRILLTGASGAIGSEVARQLAGRGARLALAGRRRERLEALQRELVRRDLAAPVLLEADLGAPGAARTLAERAEDALGGVDVLVNNAGASMQGLAWVVGDGDGGRAVLETNFWSPLALIAALVPSMLERGSGTVVNVGSMARVSPFPHLGHYAASRAALASVTDVLDMELGPRGIRVIEVALGPVDTPASRENRRLAGADRWLDGRPGLGEVSRAAQAIVTAVAGEAGRVTFYPRVLRWPHALPGLGRRYARRCARHADLGDVTVRFGGSSGDPDLRLLRDDAAEQ